MRLTDTVQSLRVTRESLRPDMIVFFGYAHALRRGTVREICSQPGGWAVRIASSSTVYDLKEEVCHSIPSMGSFDMFPDLQSWIEARESEISEAARVYRLDNPDCEFAYRSPVDDKENDK